MTTLNQRIGQAMGAHARGQMEAEKADHPKGQLYRKGQRVRIVGERWGEHKGKLATVKCSYYQAFNWMSVRCDDGRESERDLESMNSYCLDIDGHGQVSWFYPDEIEAI